jgi:hypothetical protein
MNMTNAQDFEGTYQYVKSLHEGKVSLKMAAASSYQTMSTVHMALDLKGP